MTRHEHLPGKGKGHTDEQVWDDAPDANELQPRKVPAGADEDWTASTQAEAAQDSQSLRDQHQEGLTRDRLTRHTQGTHQVETVITRTKQASKLLLTLSVVGAVLIFLIGLLSLPQIRELLNLLPFVSLSEQTLENSHWQTYLLLFIPTTLMAVLSITLWVTGLRFSAQIYGGVVDGENDGGTNNETIAECLKTVQELTKQTGGG